MSTCTDCIHHDICYQWLTKIEPDMPSDKFTDICDKFKQRELWLQIPCPIGTPVYRVCKGRYDVDGYGMSWEEGWIIVTNKFSADMSKEIGKNVFLTREQAEKVLNEHIAEDIKRNYRRK